ncbi:MAG: hypothetical protein C5B49_11650 [Bdellovibrio sp.]|nr:MAG: hypothetical protein C5B49_11650 [Bdellovibrio sp.]
MRGLLFLISIVFVASWALARDTLLIGDSLTCGPFGAQIVKSLTRSPTESVTLYCATGSSPNNWIKGRFPRRSNDPPSYFTCRTCTGGLGCTNWFTKGNPDEGDLEPCSDPTTGTGHDLANILTALTARNKKKFDRVVVALGINKGPKDTLAGDEYSDMAKIIKGKVANVDSCIWIGPPERDETKPVFDEAEFNAKISQEFKRNAGKYAIDGNEQEKKAFFEALKRDAKTKAIERIEKDRRENVEYKASLGAFYDSLKGSIDGRCTLVDSRKLMPEPKPADTAPDGVHRQPSSARKWAARIMEEIKKLEALGEAQDDRSRIKPGQAPEGPKSPGNP